MEVTIINDTENTIYKLNLPIQDITTVEEAIKMFVKAQFLTEIDNQSEPQRNKEFIELLQQQNKNLLEENKLKTTIIQILIENQNNLNKVNLESNSTQKIEIHENQTENYSIHKTDEIKCSNRYGPLYTDYNDDESCNSYDTSTSSDKNSDEISSGNIQKKTNRRISTKRKETKGKDKNTVIKEKEENRK